VPILKPRIYLTLFSLGAFPLLAQPSGMQCTHGTAHTHHRSSHHLQIKTSDRAIIKWDQFSIDKHEITEFVQPGKNSAVLNRIVGGNASHLLGSLQANGQVFVLNPAGILIGENASIDTASFIASTFDVLDDDFLKGSELNFFGSSKEPLINLGTIRAFDQDIILLAHQIQNEGTLSAPGGTVALGCGQEILLKMNDKEKIYIRPTQGEKSETGIENRGQIEALTAELKADGNLYALAIKDDGITEATGTLERNGRIYLIAEKGVVETSSQLTAKNEDKTGGTIHILGDQLLIKDQTSLDTSGDFAGGEILIGGDFQGKNPLISNATFTGIEEGAKINADCNIEGKGGKVIIWSDHTTRYYGNLSAQGGREGGDGGFAEISGNYLTFNGPVNLKSSQGNPGHLLLDPINVTISNANQTSGINLSTTPATLNCGVSPNIINTTSLSNALNASTVTISTSSCNFGSDNGNILIPNGFSTAATFKLTLNANNDIHAQAGISSGGSFEFNANGSIVFTQELGGGGTRYPITGHFITLNGASIVTGPLSATVNFASQISLTSTLGIIDTGNLTSIDGSITCVSQAAIRIPNITTQKGPISLRANSDIDIGSLSTAAMEGLASLTSTNSNINISGFINYKGFSPITLNAGQNIILNGDTAQIISPFSAINMTAGGGVILNASNNNPSVPTVITGNNAVNITAGSLTLNPTSQSASISSITSNVNLNIGTGGVALNAQNGTPALIFSPISTTWSIGGPLSLFGDATVRSSGDLNITSSGINVEGSMSSSDGNALITSVGNMILTSNAGIIQVIGGGSEEENNNNSDASITVTGNGSQLVLNTPNFDLDLMGGIGRVSSYARITTASGPISINPSGTPGDNLVLVGGSGTISDATIQPGSGGLIANFFSEVVMQGGTSSSNGSANLLANGNVSLTGHSFELFGMPGNNQVNVASTLNATTIHGTGHMDLFQDARISGATGVDIEMTDAISMSGNPVVESHGGTLLMIAGTNMTISGSSRISNSGGDVTLVVDNLYPVPDFFGPGFFDFTGGTIASSGALRIFTSVRGENTITVPLNGQTFVAGPLYIDSATEQWGTYYNPDDLPDYGGESYMLFYKDSAVNPSPGQPGFPFPGLSPFNLFPRNTVVSTLNRSDIDVSQFFYTATVDTADDILWWSLDFKLCYDIQEFTHLPQIQGALSTYQISDPCKPLFIKRKRRFPQLPLPPFKESLKAELAQLKPL
jgi:filamentous hemagglutinin family protein